jgi:hypothetical protein
MTPMDKPVFALPHVAKSSLSKLNVRLNQFSNQQLATGNYFNAGAAAAEFSVMLCPYLWR